MYPSVTFKTISRSRSRGLRPRSTPSFLCASKETKQRNTPELLACHSLRRWQVPSMKSALGGAAKTRLRLKHFPLCFAKRRFHSGGVTRGDKSKARPVYPFVFVPAFVPAFVLAFVLDPFAIRSACASLGEERNFTIKRTLTSPTPARNNSGELQRSREHFANSSSQGTVETLATVIKKPFFASFLLAWTKRTAAVGPRTDGLDSKKSTKLS